MELASKSVFLQKCPDYSEQNLEKCFGKILAPAVSPFRLDAARVLLKPNLISARTGSLSCTEGAFIVAVAKWFVERNAHVTIGDSPAFGTASGALRKIGVAEALQRLSVPIADFKRISPVTLPSGLQVGMAADALDCDLLVNMPRVKAHAQLRVTLAVKNLFGCVIGMRKALWHMAYGGKVGGFADHIVELMDVLPESISLVDGITAMHRTGPIGGRPFPLGLMACGANPVAVDRALLAVLGIPPESSPLMMSCLRKGLRGTDIAVLVFPLIRPETLTVDSFVVPEELSPVRFNPFRFLRGSMKRIWFKLVSAS